MNGRVIRRHRLAHIAELRVSDEVLRRRYARNSSISNCRGCCCREGVDVDIVERDRILANARLVQAQMDAGQERHRASWFGEPFEDPDFPSGRAASTRLHGGTCTFADGDGLCVLHKVESLGRPGVGELKPFYCRAYPLSIVEGTLVLDDKPCPGQATCCGAAETGTLSIFELCAFELEFVLGAEGVRDLRQLADTNTST